MNLLKNLIQRVCWLFVFENLKFSLYFNILI